MAFMFLVEESGLLSYVKKNDEHPHGAGCAYEAAINVLDVKFASPGGRNLLRQFQEQFGLVQRGGWVCDLEPIVRAVQLLALSEISNPLGELRYMTDVGDELPSVCSRNEGIIVQSECHYWAYRYVRSLRAYVKIDAYSSTVVHFENKMAVMRHIEDEVVAGTILAVYYVTLRPFSA
jgi:hypothetical protein